MNIDNILTFHNPNFPKAWFVEQAKWHKEQDLLIQGDYGVCSMIGDTNKGCFIGCTFPNKHQDGYNMAGICPQLLYLFDKYFEKTKNHLSLPLWVWENMPEGVDSFEIFSKFMGEMLINPDCSAYGKNNVTDKYLKIVSDLYLSDCKDKYKKVTAYATNTKFYTASYAAANAAAYSSYAATAAAYENQLELLKKVILSFKK
jgi:hypothetical protein